jgi:hypothetical protein
LIILCEQCHIFFCHFPQIAFFIKQLFFPNLAKCKCLALCVHVCEDTTAPECVLCEGAMRERKITIFYFSLRTDMFKKVVTARACKKSHFIIFRRKRTCLKKWQLRNCATARACKKSQFIISCGRSCPKKWIFFCGIFLKCKQRNDRTNNRTNERTNEPTT